MTDREMLELAAKTIGRHFSWSDRYRCGEIWKDGDVTKKFWSPVNDDGDALRLRNRMNMLVADEGTCVYVETSTYPFPTIQVREPYERDVGGGYASEMAVDAATRLAITRAAAEIGRRMSDE